MNAYKERFYGTRIYDYYLDIIIEGMRESTYAFYPLGKLGYRIDFRGYGFTVLFSEQYRNIQVIKHKEDQSLDYDTMLIIEKQEIIDLCLGYKQMCLAHGITDYSGHSFKAVLNSKERNQVQRKINDFKRARNQKRLEELRTIFN